MKESKKLIILIFILTCILCFLPYALFAEVPKIINYQVKLLDSSGVILNGAYNITFKIYDAVSDGELLWEETHENVVIQKGICSIILGGVTNLDIAFDKPYWIAIQVGADPEMTPRQGMASVGYALISKTSEKIDTNEIIDAKGGLVLENRTSNPVSPVTGQIWLKID